MYKIILASQSPRRAELLSMLCCEFTKISLDVNEVWPDNLPSKDVAFHLARLKSDAYHSRLKRNELLITADSVVISNDKILGKPETEEQAREYLRMLSDSAHLVITAVCLSTTKKTITFDETAEVTFAPISDKEIDYYIKNFNPFDKAGAYGIQEWLGMTKALSITGTYTNIMGLPTAALYRQLVVHFPEYLK